MLRVWFEKKLVMALFCKPTAQIWMAVDNATCAARFPVVKAQSRTCLRRSCFWTPVGARVYNKLQEFIRAEYRLRNFEEVVTPNIYSCDLWKRSGGAGVQREAGFAYATASAAFPVLV